MELELEGQSVLITGSSQGIGKGIAEAFLKEQAHVILTGQQASKLDKTKKKFVAQFGQAQISSFVGDLQQESVLLELANFIDDRWGKLDHLVCNIGSGRSVPLLQEDRNEMQRMLDLNLLGSVTAVRLMTPLLERAGSNGGVPSIIFIGSICGVEAIGCPVAYATAKSALMSYTQNIARPLARKNIRVNIISPGNILFEGSTWEDKLARDPAVVETMLEREVPLNRLGTLEEVGSVAAFLASKRAGFVSGSNWLVDGGQTR
jgi:3-oxoacyl-[acyl-carrier protein] reductase